MIEHSQSDRRRASLSQLTSGVLASFAGGLHVHGDHQPVGFGRYRILRLLDWQPEAALFVAHDPLLDRRVVLELLASEHAEQRLALARKLAVAGEPGLAVVYETGEHDGLPCVVTELVEGPRLSSWAATQRWPERLTAYLAAGEGLAAAHRAGVEQLRFAPERVVVDADARVCIVEFGWTADALAPTPEQLRDQPGDARTDQFRFCASLWAALFGRPAFSGSAAQQAAAMRAGALDVVGLDSAIPASVVAALGRGLDPLPERRFASMPELLAALGPEPVRSVAERWRFAFGRRALELGVAVLLVATLAFMIAARLAARSGATDSLARIALAAMGNPPAASLQELSSALVLDAEHGDDPAAVARQFALLADRYAVHDDALGFDRVWQTGFGVAEVLSIRARWAMVDGDEHARELFAASDAVFERLVSELDGDAFGRRATVALQGRALLLRSYARLERDPKRMALARKLEQASVSRWLTAEPLQYEPPYSTNAEHLWVCEPPDALTP